MKFQVGDRVKVEFEGMVTYVPRSGNVDVRPSNREVPLIDIPASAVTVVEPVKPPRKPLPTGLGAVVRVGVFRNKYVRVSNGWVGGPLGFLVHDAVVEREADEFLDILFEGV